MFVCLRIRACMSVRASVCPRGLHQALIIRVGGGGWGGYANGQGYWGAGGAGHTWTVSEGGAPNACEGKQGVPTLCHEMLAEKEGKQ